MRTTAKRRRYESFVAFRWPLLIALALGGGAWALRLPEDAPLSLPPWAVAVPAVAALLVWGLLVARRYPPGGAALMVGVPLLALAVTITVVVLAHPRPRPSAGTPAEVSDLPAAYEVLPAGVEAAVVFREADGTTPMTVEFPPVTTLNGLWASSSAGVSSESFADDALAPSVPQDWDDTIITSGSGGSSEVTPSFQVELPLTAELERTTIAATASMSLRYPQGLFVDEFTIETESLQREVRLFVGSPEDWTFRMALDSWRAVDAFAQRPTLPPGFVGLVGLVLTVVGLVRLIRAGGRGPPPEALGNTGLVVHEVSPLPVPAVDGLLRQMRAAARNVLGPGSRRPDLLGYTGPVEDEFPSIPPQPGAADSFLVITLGSPRTGSPAQQAGVRSADTLFAVDRLPISSVDVLRSLVRKWRTGAEHQLGIRRKGQVIAIVLRM